MKNRTILFMLFTVAWVFFATPLVEKNENARFMFYVYPFILVLIVVAIKCGYDRKWQN